MPDFTTTNKFYEEIFFQQNQWTSFYPEKKTDAQLKLLDLKKKTALHKKAIIPIDTKTTVKCKKTRGCSKLLFYTQLK